MTHDPERIRGSHAKAGHPGARRHRPPGAARPATAHAAPAKLRISDVTVTEGDTGAVVAKFKVGLSRKAPAKITVKYATANQTALAGADYTAKRGTLVFKKGQKSKTIAVLVLGDTADEADETFLLRLSSPRGARLGDRTGIARIFDNDLPPPLPPGPTGPPAHPDQPQGSSGLAAARAAPDGETNISITGVLVTYLKPQVGSDPAGFFVQAEQTGPALFVALDPATLTPVPAVGDMVRFIVTEMGTTGTLRQATGIAAFAVTASGRDVASLGQDVSAAGDLVSGVTNYESEVIRLSGTVTGSFSPAEAGYVSAPFATTGVSADPNLRLRLPSTLQDALALVQGCSFTLSGTPMWRVNASAQASAWNSAELSGIVCPFGLLSAVPTSSTGVTLTFNRAVGAASVNADGSQFAISGLTVTFASASGRTVSLTTTAQVPGSVYTVAVHPSVTDSAGVAVASAANSAVFSGFQPSSLVINEVDYDQPGLDSGGFVELYNGGPATIDLATIAVVLVNGSNGGEYERHALSGTLGPGAYLVVSADPQNGAPDGIALIDTASGQLFDALSYEGPITAATFGGAVYNLVEGTALSTSVADSNSTDGSLIRSPDGRDSNNAATDWAFTTLPTPGAANPACNESGQSFDTATAIAPGTFSGQTVGACDRYYVITVPSGQTLTATVTPSSELDAGIALHDASRSEFENVDNGGAGAAETTSWQNNGATVAQVFIRLYSFTGEGGTFQLAVALS